ncbi:hypothetical protein J3459_006200 [Metarhizium acridum]|nr:hypothetical protein J3459_006200 [Metarhizium acridum]
MVFIVVALVMSVFLLSLDMTIVATAIPKITDEFKGLDKTSFLVAIFIFELGSVICGAAPSAEALITGRAIAGVGAAGLGAGAYTIIAFSAPPKQRPAFTGILGASYGFARVIVPSRGAFTDNVSWRWCFYINLPIGGLSALVILIFFQTPKSAVPVKATLLEKLAADGPSRHCLDDGATVTYILAVQYGGVAHAWDSSVVIALLVGFVAITAAWAALQYFQGERSMVPPRLARERTNWSVHGTNPTMSGVRKLPFIVAVTISTILSGTYVSATGRYQPMLLGGGAVATVGAGLLYMLDVDSSTGAWIGYQIVAGLGWGTAFQIPMIAVQGSVSPEDLAAATGMLLFFQSIGGAYLVSGSQSAFINQMVGHVLKNAPQVGPGNPCPHRRY